MHIPKRHILKKEVGIAPWQAHDLVVQRPENSKTTPYLPFFTWDRAEINLKTWKLGKYCSAEIQWATYTNDLGEEQGNHWLYCSIQYGTEGSYQKIRPLWSVETHHFQKWHRGNIFILQKKGKELIHFTVPVPNVFFLRKRKTETRIVTLNLAHNCLNGLRQRGNWAQISDHVSMLPIITHEFSVCFTLI